MIQIRKSTLADLPALMDLYDSGRRIMRRNGNMHQWTKGYPTEEVVKQDIARGNSYLCLDEDDRPMGTFAFIVGRDPTYARIYDGQWLDDMQPYGTIHHGFRYCGIIYLLNGDERLAYQKISLGKPADRTSAHKV